MQAVFLDCTGDLKRVMEDCGRKIPPDLQIMHGDPAPETVIEVCRTAEIILVEHTVIPGQALREARRLRAIIFMGTGAGSYIDLAAAESLDIQVLTTPGYGDRAVAEHAFALMFAAARDIARMDREIRGNQWFPRGGLQLSGRKVAVIGLGGIGTTFARMAEAIGMRVAGWNRTPREEPFFVGDIETALSGADVVSLHLALNAGTAGLLDRRHLNLPNRGFLFINTARAQLVDEGAVIDALECGQIGHAAVDVFEEEPLPSTHPLKSHPSVTLTAHSAYMTDDAYAELWRRAMAAFDGLVGERVGA